ncbi:sugar kinase [Aliiruegeria lutimaris]|uniref:2-dehydro-3-deoxygluconokinase n=1 Tax=Aliiruegeria lutimaris TaxID=571298 RepID=A0A1G8JYH4_9RHOB|nr:sugar kinase [Aliiruegeria lutimaris]SDI36218.1 2-dehydro-3-deoxygluconokinase [Aliiruegeria lutimaris]
MPETFKRIACVGEAMIELSLGASEGAARVGYAGDTLNTAIYLRRLLPEDYEVEFVSAVGVDPLSDRMLAFIESEGVGVAHMRRHPDRIPGLYAITTDDAGERSFTYWRSASAARTLFADDGGETFAALSRFDLVYFSAITLAILSPAQRADLFAWIDGFRAAGGKVAFDSNFRPKLWENLATAQKDVEIAWRKCDIAFPSVDDEMDLFGDADAEAVMQRFEGYGVPYGALKRGGEGPLPIGVSLDTPNSYRMVDKVVDTTAAGDSFIGGFLSQYAQGAGIGAALLAGHECAARVITCPGAIIPKEIWNAGA